MFSTVRGSCRLFLPKQKYNSIDSAVEYSTFGCVCACVWESGKNRTTDMMTYNRCTARGEIQKHSITRRVHNGWKVYWIIQFTRYALLFFSLLLLMQLAVNNISPPHTNCEPYTSNMNSKATTTTNWPFFIQLLHICPFTWHGKT